MSGINNNPTKEPLPEIPTPLLNDPRPAPDKDQVVSAFKTLEPTRDFSTMTKSPCAKESFIDGAAMGLGVGLLKAMKSGPGRSAANWGFGAFVLMTVGTWEYCHFKIRQKRQLMASGHSPVVSTVDLDAAKLKAAIAARQRDD
ncbi:cytochrome c oxidase assembly protein subunit 20 [Entomortierella parvispora]|uniref:Cytochrome c oxidase assembly protein COX20, mitochondrial n=1 Tax=Entomortierella parvispora TaxID=205924 RepID=A0A9P3HJ12_9FUNG|nr:cytochrome c oxidase assembly protein subunit 20 [Entomortierella parvispora]